MATLRLDHGAGLNLDRRRVAAGAVAILTHAGVAAEIGSVPRASVNGFGLARFVVGTTSELHAALDRVYKLAVSLPDAPLDRFRSASASFPCTTEAERLVVQRIGQDLFRDALMNYWVGAARSPAFRADCDGPTPRLHKGLLLSALWDAAFDRGLERDARHTVPSRCVTERTGTIEATIVFFGQ